MQNTMLRNGLLLGLFALICTALVAAVNLMTKETIVEQQQQQLMNILHQIIPDTLHDNELSQTCTLLHAPESLGTTRPLPAYIAMKNGQPVGLAIEAVAPDGYNGEIQLIVGVRNDGTVLGVQTLSQQETPGLGDKIDSHKSNWVKSFAGMVYNSQNDKKWHVKKDGGDIDQFTGATITPRAFTKALRNALRYFEANKAAIYRQPLNCEVTK
ncbi:electron transport complex subunit RsxG [Shewanella sp. A32]|uniref:electron transport complex subunit RsxG n=1 Tax=Shewanella sp. A32 TaxID=3031327 RepID=UPI0023B95FEC|nr:electron transport complex subunit RsxG [Shewanella sp. A32]MDF0535934.1 electron transport complex subunit RsxG [Shewanella sp. A32]